MKFKYRIPGYFSEDEWGDVEASSFEDAAEKACDIKDSGGDYTIIGRGFLDEIIIKNPFGEIRRFSITAEAVRAYYAREIK